MKLGLLGHHISYSLSPKIFESISQTLNEPITYDLYDVEVHKIEHVIEKLRTGELLGLNVTKPYKEVIMKYCEELVGDAKTIGSVNTLFYDEDKVKGYNTDVFGFQKLLFTQPINKNIPLYVFGNGGAAKAVVHILNKFHLTFMVVKRKRSRRPIIHHQEIFYEDVSEGPGMIIQTTSVGINNDDQLLVNENIVEGKTVIDLIYHHQETIHMKLADKKMNGLVMLIFQALKSYDIWTTKDLTQHEDVIKNIKEVLNNELYRKNI